MAKIENNKIALKASFFWGKSSLKICEVFVNLINSRPDRNRQKSTEVMLHSKISRERSIKFHCLRERIERGKNRQI